MIYSMNTTTCDDLYKGFAQLVKIGIIARKNKHYLHEDPLLTLTHPYINTKHNKVQVDLPRLPVVYDVDAVVVVVVSRSWLEEVAMMEDGDGRLA